MLLAAGEVVVHSDNNLIFTFLQRQVERSIGKGQASARLLAHTLDAIKILALERGPSVHEDPDFSRPPDIHMSYQVVVALIVVLSQMPACRNGTSPFACHRSGVMGTSVCSNARTGWESPAMEAKNSDLRGQSSTFVHFVHLDDVDMCSSIRRIGRLSPLY